MASLMDRLRSYFATTHSDEHADIQAKMSEHELRLAVIDARIDADNARHKERRHIVLPRHPDRRSSDAR